MKLSLIRLLRRKKKEAASESPVSQKLDRVQETDVYVNPAAYWFLFALLGLLAALALTAYLFYSYKKGMFAGLNMPMSDQLGVVLIIFSLMFDVALLFIINDLVAELPEQEKTKGWQKGNKR